MKGDYNCPSIKVLIGSISMVSDVNINFNKQTNHFFIVFT